MKQKFVSISRGVMIGSLLLGALMFVWVYYESHSGRTEPSDNPYLWFLVVYVPLFIVVVLTPVALFRFYTILAKLETSERWDLLIVSLILSNAVFFVITNLQYLLRY